MRTDICDTDCAVVTRVYLSTNRAIRCLLWASSLSRWYVLNRPAGRTPDSPVWQLSVYDPSSAIPVSDFPLSLLPEAPPTINCFQALDYLCVCARRLLLIRALIVLSL